MPDRLFVETPIKGECATLTGAEAHHLLHVLRAKSGDELVLFDGRGCEFRARVKQIGRSEVVCAVLEKREIDRELPLGLTLAVALPKGERQRWLVEKLVELGASRLAPLVTERSVAQPTAKALDRLRRTVIEASKQSGRNVLMEIAEPQRWKAFAASVFGSAKRAPLCLVAHPRGGSSAFGDLSKPHGAVAAIGPEGGFTQDEIAVAQTAGWKVIDLGPRVLRIETAAVVMATRLASLPE